MKRVKLLRHIFHAGCTLLREGAKHTVVINPILKRSSTVPRHNEIDDFLARKICRDLGLEKPE